MAARLGIVVVGGGITGLASALQLQALASAREGPTEITLLEQADATGGKLRTEIVGDFVVDAGADIFIADKPEAVDLCRELGIGDRLIEPRPELRRTFSCDGHRLTPAGFYGEERLRALRGGMRELPGAALGALRRVTVLTHARVGSIARAGDRFLVRHSRGEVVTDAVVVALPALAAASVVGGIAPAAGAALHAIPYRSTFTVSAAYHADDVPHALDGYGYLVANAGAGAVSACTWTSSKLPGRAPSGSVLLRGYVNGGAGTGVDRARALVLEDLRRTLGITAPPLFVRAHAWVDGLPVLDTAREERSRLVRRAIEDCPGVAIAGGAVDGVGIPDSIRSGRAAARDVWRHLASAR